MAGKLVNYVINFKSVPSYLSAQKIIMTEKRARSSSGSTSNNMKLGADV
jgi:hypothetical protein